LTLCKDFLIAFHSRADEKNFMNFSRLSYFEQVLGIRFIPKELLLQLESAPVPVENSFWRKNLQDQNRFMPTVDCDLLFVHVRATREEPSLFESESLGLFEKMKKAMDLQNLHETTLEFVGSSEADLFQSLLTANVRVVLLMKTNPCRLLTFYALLLV